MNKTILAVVVAMGLVGSAHATTPTAADYASVAGYETHAYWQMRKDDADTEARDALTAPFPDQATIANAYKRSQDAQAKLDAIQQKGFSNYQDGSDKYELQNKGNGEFVLLRLNATGANAPDPLFHPQTFTHQLNDTEFHAAITKANTPDVQSQLDDFKVNHQADIDDLKKSANTALSTNAHQDDDIAHVKRRIAKQSDDIKFLNGRADTVEHRVDAVKQEVSGYEQRITSNTQRLDNHEQRISGVETTVAGHEQRIANNEQRVDNHEKRISSNEQRITSSEQWQQQAETSVNELIDAHNEMVDEVNSYSSAIDNNSQRISSVENHQREQDKTISSNHKKAMAGVSSAMAMAGLHYVEAHNAIAIGGGSYGGGNATAIGYKHTAGRVAWSAQTSYDTSGNVGVAGSFSVGW